VKVVKVEVLNLSKPGPEWCCPGARIWLWFFSLLVREKSVVEEQNRGSNLPAENITETYFWAKICSNFMRYFYYKYILCIRVNLEIERAENKGLKINKKTRDFA